MDIAVIGCGISGLAFGKYAKVKGVNVKLFEKNDSWGGIARVKMVDGVPYHMIGGHCFNSKYDDVKSFVFDHVLPKESWVEIERKASIQFRGHKIGYPIEYSVKEIFDFDSELATKIVRDYFRAPKDNPENLRDWFISNFGQTLAEEYFIPYNTKIWNRKPEEMTSSWVYGKLPIPSDKAILEGLVGVAKDSMPHAVFYYPKAGTQSAFIDALAKDLDIALSSFVDKVRLRDDGKYLVNGEAFDHVVYTGPLDLVHEVVDIDSKQTLDQIPKLKYNKVTTMLWESKPTNDTWTYIPDKNVRFHRLIHISNFAQIDRSCSIAEAVGEISYDEMVRGGESLSQLIAPLDYNVSERAYVVYDNESSQARLKLLEYFKGKNFHLLGRFGEWEYYNMDVCIKRAIDLFDSIVFK